jgi:cbb3-type cytochrome oxidase subunit 3
MTKRKIIFLVVFAIIQLGVIWPIYPLFSGIYPIILGLPLSFAWIVFMLLSCFCLLLWYYLSDPQLKSNQPEGK